LSVLKPLIPHSVLMSDSAMDPFYDPQFRVDVPQEYDGVVEEEDVQQGPSFTDTAKTKVKAALTTRSFYVLWFVPCFVFVVTMLIWTYLLLLATGFCIFWTAGLCIAACLLVTPCVRRSIALAVPLAILCIPAILVGSFFGSYIHEGYQVYTTFYSNTRKYENVDSSQPASAVADAGKLIFTEGTYVDVNNSVSYKAETGKVYCIAPIHTDASVTSIEFWAVGVNCCDKDGNFACDDSTDASVHSGAVVFDSEGFLTSSRYSYYELAQEKAEASYGLSTVEAALFVRWLNEDSLEYMQHHYRNLAIIFWIVCASVYCIISCALAFSLYQYSKVIFVKR